VRRSHLGKQLARGALEHRLRRRGPIDVQVDRIVYVAPTCVEFHDAPKAQAMKPIGLCWLRHTPESDATVPRMRMMLIVAVAGGSLLLPVSSIAKSTPKSLRGEWTRTVKATERNQANSLAGDWELKLSKRKFVLTPREDRDFIPWPPARVDWRTKRVTFYDQQKNAYPECRKGRYTWKVKNGSLRFKVVKDACRNRKAILSGAWSGR
jgi:hypothetical protein